ncbi:MAG: FHA domain-containing protein [Clostridium sp.]|nr:FHA domain-containing protein [Clostridium sp.]
MAFTECANGHLYDSDQYATCPYCNGGGNRIEFGGGASDVGKTAPVGGGFGPAGNFGASGAVPPAGTAGMSGIGATVAPQSYRAAKAEAEEEDTGKTVGVFQKSMKLEPVVGWLVCIEGPDKGKDFRIWAKNNTIGRSEKMDICIKGDTTISRENHARIAYDDKHNNYHLIPAESTNNIYLNDEPIYIPTKLTAYDLIEFGDSQFLFVPFCNETFTWRDGVKK